MCFAVPLGIKHRLAGQCHGAHRRIWIVAAKTAIDCQANVLGNIGSEHRLLALDRRGKQHGTLSTNDAAIWNKQSGSDPGLAKIFVLDLIHVEPVRYLQLRSNVLIPISGSGD